MLAGAWRREAERSSVRGWTAKRLSDGLCIERATLVLATVRAAVEADLVPVGDVAAVMAHHLHGVEARLLQRGRKVYAIPHPLVGLAPLAGVTEQEVLEAPAPGALEARTVGLPPNRLLQEGRYRVVMVGRRIFQAREVAADDWLEIGTDDPMNSPRAEDAAHFGEESRDRVAIDVLQHVRVVDGVHARIGGRNPLAQVVHQDLALHALEALEPLAGEDQRHHAARQASIESRVDRKVDV